MASQRWKLWLAAAVLVVVGAGLVAPDAWSALTGGRPVMIKLAAMAAGLILLIGACAAVRCRSCGLGLLWYSLSRKGINAWLDWLLEARTCPRCGHEEKLLEEKRPQA